MIDTTYNLITWKRNWGNSFHSKALCNGRKIRMSLLSAVAIVIILILLHSLHFFAWLFWSCAGISSVFLQKVGVLMPKLRTTRDVGQECSCPPGLSLLFVSLFNLPQHTNKTVKTRTLSGQRSSLGMTACVWNLRVCLHVMLLAALLNLKTICVCARVSFSVWRIIAP